MLNSNKSVKRIPIVTKKKCGLKILKKGVSEMLRTYILGGVGAARAGHADYATDVGFQRSLFGQLIGTTSNREMV